MNKRNTPNGDTLCLILLTLHAEGPLNLTEIIEETGLDRQQVEKSLYHTRRKYGSKVIAIHAWEPRHSDTGGRPVPRFGPARHRDAPSIVEGKAVTQARYREKNRMKINMANRLSRGRTPVSPFYGLMK